jgi:hypothetical protein
MQGALEQEREALDDFSTVTMLATRRLGSEMQDTACVDIGLQLAQNASALYLI